jgi:hypothetical protein
MAQHMLIDKPGFHIQVRIPGYPNSHEFARPSFPQILNVMFAHAVQMLGGQGI